MLGGLSMKSIKRILSFLLTTALLLSLVACGEQEVKKGQKREPSHSNEVTKPEDKPGTDKPTDVTPEPTKPVDITPEPTKPAVPEDRASAEAVAKAFAKRLEAGDFQGAMKYVELSALPATRISAEIGVPMEQLLPFLDDIDLGYEALESKYPSLVKTLKNSAYAYDESLYYQWYDSLHFFWGLTRNWTGFATNEVGIELDMIEDSERFLPTTSKTAASYVIILNSTVTRKEHRGYLGIDKVNGAYSIFYVAKYNQWPDFSTTWSPKVQPPKIQTPLQRDTDNMFFVDFALLGMSYQELGKVLGDTLPTPQEWEWGTYDSFFDYNYHGLPCTFFLVGDRIYGIRFEFVSGYGHISRDLYERAVDEYYLYELRTDQYGHVIPEGEPEFGYRFRTLWTTVEFDLFYNYYDDTPHTALHYSYLNPEHCN